MDFEFLKVSCEDAPILTRAPNKGNTPPELGFVFGAVMGGHLEFSVFSSSVYRLFD